MGHRSIYHDGWRAVCPWPGTSFTEAGAFFGAPIDKDKLTELDAKGWELYHIEKDFAENHNLAAENRAEADRDDRDLVRRGGQVQRPAGRLARHDCASPTRGRRSRSRATSYTLLPGHAGGADQRLPERAEPAPQHHGRCRDPQGRRRRRAVLGRRCPGRLLLLRAGRQAPLRLQLRRAASSSTSSRTFPCPRDATSCASSSR